jgi:hypothetical protein
LDALNMSNTMNLLITGWFFPPHLRRKQRFGSSGAEWPSGAMGNAS